MKVSYAMIRLIVEREQVTAITGCIATVDPPERFHDADDAIYPHFALDADRDIDDGRRSQAKLTSTSDADHSGRRYQRASRTPETWTCQPAGWQR